MKKQSQWQLFFVAYLAYAAIYVARLNLTVATPVLQEKGILSAAQIGVMSGAFFLFYSLGQLFNGWLGDILPPRRMVAAGLFLTAGTNLMIGLILTVETAICFWAVNGFAQSMLWGPLLRAVGSRFAPEKKSLVASFLVSSVGVGSVLGIVLATAAIQKKGVNYAFCVPGIFSLAAAMIVVIFFHAEVKEKVAGDKEGKQKNRSFAAVLNFRLLLLMIPAMLHGVIKDGVNLWVAAYFMDTFGVDLVEMSFYVFAVPLLSLMGRLIYPFFYQIFHQKEHMVSAVFLGICIICMLPLCLPRIPIGAAALFLGITAAAISLVNTSFLTIYPMRYQAEGNVSKIVGVMDFATYAGAGMGSLVCGVWLEKYSYAGMFFAWSILCVLAIGVLVFWEKNFCSLVKG